MSTLKSEQKQLLFDYSIGLTTEQQEAEAKSLISTSPEAFEVYAMLKAALNPLDSLEEEQCPDELVESTIMRLNNLARASHLRLNQLLAVEQAKPSTKSSSFWRNSSQFIATAAAIIFVATISFPTLKHARQDYWQLSCQKQLSSIFQGINNYTSDNDGKLPAVAASNGEPWWKVGYQGNENHSNTRNAWLLVKKGYVSPNDFVCPGSRQGRAIQFDSSQVKCYNDFPTRRYVTYSYRISRGGSAETGGRRILISDLNPLFEKLPHDYSKPFVVQIHGGMMTVNSSNHGGCGQNVLFIDGSSEFIKTRQIGISKDDIFTLQGTEVYKGTEVPSSESDEFLAP